MPAISTPPASNVLINSLPTSFRADFLAQCGLVYLSTEKQTGGNSLDSTHIYFPVDGVVGLRFSLDKSQGLDVAMIGSEGMYGASLWHVDSTGNINGVVRQAGYFLQIKSINYLHFLGQHAALQVTIDNWVSELLGQIAQSAACVCFHDVRSRLATLLLMTLDRIQRDDLQLTHHCLADSMGVRRSAVSIAASSLQKDALIHYARGKIGLVSREGMEQAACNCYRAIRNH